MVFEIKIITLSSNCKNMHNVKRIPVYLGMAALLVLMLAGCGRSGQKKLIVFHAGSLSVPLEAISKAYMESHPGVKVLLEGAGSRECARKIAELGKDCDVFASADYTVIEELLIPDHATWYINFASNEMCIAYTEKSRFHDSINAANWISILSRPDVLYGRSDPDLDPCGYRTVLSLKLSEDHYRLPGFAGHMLDKDNAYIRPKETDLLALLESHAIDYIFIYRSVAMQHGLKYILLPDSVNLGDPGQQMYYAGVSVDVSGKRSGEVITKTGEAMIYGLTIPLDAPEYEIALGFVDFMLGPQGMKIMEEMGQASVIPDCSKHYIHIPEILKQYAKDCD